VGEMTARGVTPEGLGRSMSAVSTTGTFGAAALSGLGFGDTVATDQLDEAKKTNKKLDRIDDRIRVAGAVFGA
jgi:hypothetical protein